MTCMGDHVPDSCSRLEMIKVNEFISVIRICIKLTDVDTVTKICIYYQKIMAYVEQRRASIR